jgi:[glutamine synthetase] adenylyltransferase / [glutamine synthetase]-adenylyl-L-tyrosine phosphorylase
MDSATDRLHTLLASVPDPAKAARYLDRFRHDAPADFARIAESPAALRCAVHLFAYSSFLSDAVLRNPERILEVAASGSFYRALTVDEYIQRLYEFLDDESVPEAIDLARFRRRQLLRIALRDVLGVATLSDVTEELSALADAILDVTYRRIRADFVSRYGEPRLSDGASCGFSVISLGKLGGQELNYSSDIDLMFLYAANGETDGPDPITNREFYKKVANQYTALLSTYTADGQCYRVDLRLRPDGTLGEICISEDGARAYYSDRARDWEKQMLIKARVSAGEPGPGAALLDFVEPLIYRTSLDFRAVEAVSETRQRISEKMAARRGAPKGLDIKLMPGGIRDIEFLVQCLQRLHGGRQHWVRHAGTMLAMFRLRDKDLLSGGEYARLAAAYQFLRYLEHRLQMEDDRQTHTLPTSPTDLDLLARKMPLGTAGDPATGAALLACVEEHRAAVQEIYDRVVRAQKPLTYTIAVEAEAPEPPPQIPEPVVVANLNRGRDRLEQFLQRAAATPGLLPRLDADPRLSAQVLDIFEHSPFFADDLFRDPELLEEIGKPFEAAPDPLPGGTELRRFYRQQMVRIQTASILESEHIFSTLGKTSLLADRVIGSAYQLAVAATPPHASYTPAGQMMVIALGRLGLGEFDLGSDADLIFVLPDADAGEHSYWTAVAERIVQILSAYTGQGVMFAVDTRLRPNGREGDLVQSEGAYKTYFSSHAEAWEGITYMKARGVAGNVERATEFLHELQDVDWRRYGQSMRSRKELAEMRARIEREQGPRNPLKAGAGGYYDIDFALMYLRLRGAGIFYKVLNTPERIDVIEKMGHLDREDADFLRDAATFYRAVDHGQRVSTGRVEGSLPTAPSQLEMLTSLVHRWTPTHLHRRSLDLTLQEIRRTTRDFFNRLFAR